VVLACMVLGVSAAVSVAGEAHRCE
jgi:hypothetical protein